MSVPPSFINGFNPTIFLHGKQQTESNIYMERLKSLNDQHNTEIGEYNWRTDTAEYNWRTDTDTIGGLILQ